MPTTVRTSGSTPCRARATTSAERERPADVHDECARRRIAPAHRVRSRPLDEVARRRAERAGERRRRSTSASSCTTTTHLRRAAASSVAIRRRPGRAARRRSRPATLTTAYSNARSSSPSRQRSASSVANVENVVKAPSTPIPTRSRSQWSGVPRRTSDSSSTVSRNAPATLMHERRRRERAGADGECPAEPVATERADRAPDARRGGSARLRDRRQPRSAGIFGPVGDARTRRRATR